MNETTDMTQAPTDAGPRTAPPPALRPLTGLVGRGSELGRLLGHIDARRYVRIEAARGAGVTALLRALCAEPPRPAVPDGTIALPVGLPVTDLPAVAQILSPNASTPIAARQLLVLLDDRDITRDEVDTLHEAFARSVLVVTGGPDAGEADLVPVAVQGLSQHHAVGLVEAAMGRALSIEEGRAARSVATAVDGMPGPLVQAAAAVRDAGMTFDDVLDLLDDPPRPTALAVSLQHALGDELHVTLSHVRALGDVPAPTSLAAAACGVDVAEATRRLRRLAMLGLVVSDGRDGWSASSAVPAVSEPVRIGAASRVAEWLAETDETLDVFSAASALAVMADRIESGDRPGALALAEATRPRLLDGLEQTQALLDSATTWGMDDPTRTPRTAGATAAAVPATTSAPLDRHEQEAEPIDRDGTADESRTRLEDSHNHGSDVLSPDPAAHGLASSVSDDHDRIGTTTLTADASHATATSSSGGDISAVGSGAQGAIMGLLGDRRRLALIAVGAAAVIAAVLLVVPSLRDDLTPVVIRGDVDLGVTSVGETNSGTLALDLSTTTAATPVTLVLGGPDADAFMIDPAVCDGLDCRTSVTFSPDRSGIHLATVNAVDARDAQVGVAELTGSGTGDPPEATTSTNMAVTLFPSEPTPITAGGDAVVPIGVRNDGPDNSTGSQLVVTVPEQVTADAEGCSFEAPTLTCPLAELAAGASERLAVTVTLPEGIDSLRVNAAVNPLADTDDTRGDNAAGFSYSVIAPSDEQN